MGAPLQYSAYTDHDYVCDAVPRENGQNFREVRTVAGWIHGASGRGCVVLQHIQPLAGR